ncbi:RnfH family protein [Shigella flexneri]
MVQAFTTRAKEVYSASKIAVEVVYALPEKQYLQRVMLERVPPLRRLSCFRHSRIRSDIDLAKNKVGIYSRPVKLGMC